MKITETGDLWWKNAIVYCLDVETFLDWNGDGVGDFEGLGRRVDYLADIGVTCLWLMPFYPTAHRDDGYDITDYYAVDPRLGHLGDFVEFVRTARDRGMRVIVDLVVNHTSIEHPWFQQARSSLDNPYRDFYVWRSEPPPDTSGDVVFPDAEEGIWSRDDTTGEYYMHRFYKEQPDLNVANPLVRDEITKIIGFWLELGISGFRVDAVPFLIETRGIDRAAEDDMPEPHEFLRSLRRYMTRRTGDGLLLGEVNVPHDEQFRFFGGEDGDELTMLFDFIAMQKMYLSLAREDARPLVEALLDRPSGHPDSQWATFVRNHDELTLDKLTEDERQEVFAAFGPDPDMQLFGRGLRRRLPPMVGGDLGRMKMIYSLLFSLPGTPTLFYGEEIGMGENLAVEGRAAVRTPMQWTSGPNGGFSTTDDGLPAPVVTGQFGPEHVNVADQRRDPESLLQFITLLAHRYRESPELGWGSFEVLSQPHRQVLAHRSSWDEASMVAVHNLGPDPVRVALTLDDLPEGAFLVDLLADGREDVDDGGRVEVPLDGYGYRWLRVTWAGARRLS